MKIVTIGHPDAVLGFSLVGIPGQAATTTNEVQQALRDVLAREDIGIVLITEDVAQLIAEQVSRLMLRSAIPLVIEIPAPESEQTGRPSLTEVIQKTIGIRL